MNKASQEQCFLKHGPHCARKKIFELLYAERELLDEHRQTTASTAKTVSWDDDDDVFTTLASNGDQLSQPDKRDVLPPITDD